MAAVGTVRRSTLLAALAAQQFVAVVAGIARGPDFLVDQAVSAALALPVWPRWYCSWPTSEPQFQWGFAALSSWVEPCNSAAAGVPLNWIAAPRSWSGVLAAARCRYPQLPESADWVEKLHGDVVCLPAMRWCWNCPDHFGRPQLGTRTGPANYVEAGWGPGTHSLALSCRLWWRSSSR